MLPLHRHQTRVREQIHRGIRRPRHHLERCDACKLRRIRPFHLHPPRDIRQREHRVCVTTYAKQHIDIVNTDAYSNAVPHEGITTPQRIISSSAATRVTFRRPNVPGHAGTRAARKGTLVQVLHEQE